MLVRTSSNSNPIHSLECVVKYEIISEISRLKADIQRRFIENAEMPEEIQLFCET